MPAVAYSALSRSSGGGSRVFRCRGMVLSLGSTSPPPAMLPAPRIELHLVAPIPEIGARPGDVLILQVGSRAILRQRLPDRLRSRAVPRTDPKDPGER
jgi:hypothetical protein